MHPRLSTLHPPLLIARTRKSRTCECLQVPATAPANRALPSFGAAPWLASFWWVGGWPAAVGVDDVRVRILYLVTSPLSSSPLPLFPFSLFTTFSFCASQLFTLILPLVCFRGFSSFSFWIKSLLIHSLVQVSQSTAYLSLTTVPTTVSPAHATKDTKTLTLLLEIPFHVTNHFCVNRLCLFHSLSYTPDVSLLDLPRL